MVAWWGWCLGRGGEGKGGSGLLLLLLGFFELEVKGEDEVVVVGVIA